MILILIFIFQSKKHGKNPSEPPYIIISVYLLYINAFNWKKLCQVIKQWWLPFDSAIIAESKGNHQYLIKYLPVDWAHGNEHTNRRNKVMLMETKSDILGLPIQVYNNFV